METITITAEQAYALIQDEDAAFVPFRTLNAVGQDKVTNWLNANSKEKCDVALWHDEASQVASDASVGEPIQIAIDGDKTISGKQETLTLQELDFDWQING